MEDVMDAVRLVFMGATWAPPDFQSWHENNVEFKALLMSHLVVGLLVGLTLAEKDAETAHRVLKAWETWPETKGSVRPLTDLLHTLVAGVEVSE